MYTLDDSLGFVVKKLANRLRAELVAGFEAHGFDITSDQWSVLGQLSVEDGISQKELGIRTSKDKTNIARIIDVMERKGLVQRHDDGDDQRQRMIHLTESGRSTYHQLIPIAQEVLERAQRGLSTTDRAQLLTLMNQVYDNLA